MTIRLAGLLQSRSKSFMALLLAAAIGLTACSELHSTPSSGATPPTKLAGSIVVSGASSLTGAFGTLATRFESLHPGTSITLNFGSSGTLATQIVSGAPADVFASASPSDMETVVKAGDVTGKSVTFARNSLEIVVKPGNPLGIHSLADLGKAHVVAVCVQTAPCGATAAEALRKARVDISTSKITLGQNVDATFAEVTTGDADAAIVYVTNAKTVGSEGVAIPIPRSLNVTTSYPIAVIKSTTNRELAAAWIAYILGPTGQKVLREASFLPAA